MPKRSSNEVGEIRPSQLVYSFGIGAVIDLPNLSTMMLGIDDWREDQCEHLGEERLLAAVRQRLNAPVESLRLPPLKKDSASGGGGAAIQMGVPVVPFPRWLRCSLCERIAPIDSGMFALRTHPYRPERAKYVHTSCSKANEPNANPVRFLTACRNGHIDEFPWIDFVHNGQPTCKPSILRLREFGAGGDVSDIIIECEKCGLNRRMADAFSQKGRDFYCDGYHPHLRQRDTNPCDQTAQAILLGASNAWFPTVMTALAIPSPGVALKRLVDERWSDLAEIEDLSMAKYALKPTRMPEFAAYTAEEVFGEIEAKRKGGGATPSTNQLDLKLPEWQVLSNPGSAPSGSDFLLTEEPPPVGFEHLIERVVLAERLREVRAFVGFSRVESADDFGQISPKANERRAPIGRKPPKWVPAGEVRGEGIFIQFRETAVTAWLARPEIQALERRFLQSHAAWKTLRKQDLPTAGFPGLRFVLLHSVAHALMRQFALECGYTGASIRERIYSRSAGEEGGPQAGVLLATMASDSEGTLGGLVSLGRQLSLRRHLLAAFDSMAICGSDPLCSEHSPDTDGRTIHGAACHSCLFVPETSCEAGNRYLDRTTLIETCTDSTTGFFREVHESG